MASEPVRGPEQAVFGENNAGAIAGRLAGYLARHLGTGLAEVLFRAGRIDAVWGVRTDDGRDIVIKAHRAPVDLPAREATVAAQRILVAAGFPCPVPLSGPDRFDGLVLSAETLIGGGVVESGRRPGARRAMAGGLAADRLVAAYDWDLFADTEAVIAGMSAGSYTTVGSDGGTPPTPDEVAAFLRDYDGFRARPFTAGEQHTAAATAAWALAYVARCELGMLPAGSSSAPALDLIRWHGREYLAVAW